ncbi:membrane steroid-binding protein 2-like protein [Tanacetum coccineum]
MAVEFMETINKTITSYTGLLPNAFFTVIASAIVVYYIFSVIFGDGADTRLKPRPRSFKAEESQPLPPPVQLGEISEEELKGYDGVDASKPLLKAIKGQIYDVTQSRMFYGLGEPYALFTGKDASRALAKMSFKEKDLNGDLTRLGAFELDALQDWEYKFMSKYVKVGTIKKPKDSPAASTVAKPAKTTESNAAEPSMAAAHVLELTEATEEKEDTPTTTQIND